MKSIVIIGSGNVAEALAKAFAKARGYDLLQISGRNEKRVKEISSAAGCGYAVAPAKPARADIYIIAVSDRAIAEVAAGFNVGDSVVAHTAGSVGIEELSAAIKNRGALYPLQTFTAGREVNMAEVPLFVEGSNEYTAGILKGLGAAISDSVRECGPEERMKLHMAAVFACNFTNHLYVMAEEMLDETGIPRGVLKPLIRETAAKAIAAKNAAFVQTGPAVRNDAPTMKKHLDLLAGCPQLQELYRIISSDIWETSKKISRK